MPIYDYKYLLTEAEAFTTAAYTTDVTDIKFPVASPNWGRNEKFGLHIVVTTTFATLTSGVIIWLMQGAATSPTTKATGRFFSAAQLTAGKHYFIPGPATLLQFVRAYFDPVSEAATAGALTAWLGPDADGAE